VLALQQTFVCERYLLGLRRLDQNADARNGGSDIYALHATNLASIDVSVATPGSLMIVQTASRRWVIKGVSHWGGQFLSARHGKIPGPVPWEAVGMSVPSGWLSGPGAAALELRPVRSPTASPAASGRRVTAVAVGHFRSARLDRGQARRGVEPRPQLRPPGDLALPAPGRRRPDGKGPP
jgi:hypothetical protein